MITGKYPPHDPLPAIKVELLDNQIHTFSNEDGQFEFSHLKPGSYAIMFSANDYVSQAETLDVVSSEVTNCLIRLNGAPEISGVSLITKHIAHWQPAEDEYVLDVHAGVSDLDGNLDIDSVQFQIPGWGFDTLLTSGSAAGDFTGVFFNDAFGANAFPELEGEMLRLRCIDKSGDWGTWFITQISRLIVSSPQILSPAGLATVDSLPVFRWSHFDAGFQVHYQVDVFRLDESAIPQFVLSSPVLADTTLQWQTSNPFADARYYWTMSVIDRYGNISVSKEAAFQVQ